MSDVSSKPTVYFAPLDAALDRINVGEPLLIDIFDADKVLLLACGKVVESDSQLRALIERGSLVDLDEVRDPLQLAKYSPRRRLPELWDQTSDRINAILSSYEEPLFESRLQSTLPVIEELITRDPDLTVFQVVRQAAPVRHAHAARQSMLAASVSMLVSRRIGWVGSSADTAAKCALTMNLAILDLLGRLAVRQTAPTPREQELIQTHPTRGREILENAGITDQDWLRAVSEHHERPDGSGYPLGLKNPSESGQLVQCADAFVGGLIDASLGAPITASGVLRTMYLENPSSPFVAALIKELGVYPAGSIVRLANDEIGMVVKQGPTSTTPVVAVVPVRGNRPILEPVFRYTECTDFTVVSVLPGREFSPAFCRQLFAIFSTSG
jgi:hypothetical protein